MIPLLLASTSPRRQALLRAAKIAFRAIPPGIEPEGAGPPIERARQRAAAKARGAGLPGGPPGAVLGVDTVVELDGEELGKPGDRAVAGEMLRRLQGRQHSVHTAHHLWLPERGIALERTASAVVSCRGLTEPEVQAFLDTGAWRGKAGGYGIQDPEASFLTLVAGDRDTVIGLHVAAVRELLAAAAGEGSR